MILVYSINAILCVLHIYYYGSQDKRSSFLCLRWKSAHLSWNVFVSVRCWNCFFFFFFFLFLWFALFFFRRAANSRSSLCYVKVFSCCCIRLHMIQFMVFQNRKIATITPMSIHQFNQKRMNWSEEMKTSQLFTVRQMQIFY